MEKSPNAFTKLVLRRPYLGAFCQQVCGFSLERLFLGGALAGAASAFFPHRIHAL